MPTREDFIPEQGLFDDGDATIIGAWFGPKEEYKTSSGDTPDLLNIILEDELLEKPIEQGYSLGAAMLWQPSQDRSEVGSGKKPGAKAFMKNSRAYQLVESILKAVGDGSVEKGQDTLIPRGFFMTQAGFYTGMRFHWKRIKMAQVTGGESDVLLPSKFLGFVQAVPQAPNVSATQVQANGNFDTLIEEIIKIAPGKDERDLKRAIMADPKLKADTTFTNAVFNKGLLKELVQKGQLIQDPSGKYI